MRKFLVPAALATLPLLAAPACASSFAGTTAGTSAGGTSYLAGGGAQGYQEDDVFKGQGIDVVYQGFSPRPYGREERYVPGLSVIDYLMEDGRPLAEAFPA